ncbi:MAG: DUF305 domain-containing protein [Hyphomicrobiaceae bacterium]
MQTRLLCLGTALFMCLSTAVALAQKAADPAHQHHDHATKAAGIPAAGAPLSEASKAYEAAAQKMHKDMSSEYTNDVDVDFVRGMIPHHQGAIDQAEILLKYSKNLRLRRLAGGIIASQRREIRFMQKWLKERESGIESKDMPAWLKANPSTVEEAKKLGDR